MPSPQACFPASVNRVIDGDTVVALTSSGEIRVRVAQIDAPERSQSFGHEATQCLASMVQNRDVSLCTAGNDRYGRTVANIAVGAVDVGEQMVARGCAWAYTKYLEAGSQLPTIQWQASVSGVGLWAYGYGTAPWEYRAGVGPVYFLNGMTAVNVSAPTRAASHERVFDWVEHRFPDVAFSGTATTSDDFGLGVVRCYGSGFCIRYEPALSSFFVVSPDGQKSFAGTEADLLPAVSADGF